MIRWISENNTKGIDVETVSEDELSRISFLQHPQQVLAVFPIPSISESDDYNKALKGKLTLALDSVQDPGNLGTIIRIADWFGIETILTILCSHDTADAYNPKVIQATMGSIARVRIIYTDLPKTLESLASSMPIYGTFLDGENIHAKQLPEEAIIVMKTGDRQDTDTQLSRRPANRRFAQRGHCHSHHLRGIQKELLSVHN